MCLKNRKIKLMSNYRIYGRSPYSIIVVHGGPGAAGEMKPVAEELSQFFGVIEPIQTKDSIKGQIDELKEVIERNASIPVILIGWSWGAWLSYFFAAKYPKLVKKLVLVSSGPFEESYAQQIMPTKLSRLSQQERVKASEIIGLLQSGQINEEIFNEFGQLMDKADSFKTIPHKNEYSLGLDKNSQSKIYEKVWSEAEQLRKTGELLEMGKTITCSVVAIHGDYDSHPAKGVSKPLASALHDFKFVLLKNCGHHPWFEKKAKDKFYDLLRSEISAILRNS